MLRKTGKAYEIRVVEEFGTNGFIFAQMRDCVHHVRDAGNGLHLPASPIKDIFVYYNTFLKRTNICAHIEKTKIVVYLLHYIIKTKKRTTFFS